MAWVDFTEQRRPYSVDYGCILLGFLQARIGKLGVEDEDFEVHENVSMYGPTS